MNNQKSNETPDALPLVTMVIPAYNHARYVKKCIESAIAQDYANIELIIIDDGSADDTVSVIEGMSAHCQARFVRYEFRSRPNKGHSATLNEAIQWANGKYFSYMGSDDILYPCKISRLVEIINDRPSLSVIFSGAEVIDEHSAVTSLKKNNAAVCSFDDVFILKYHLVAPSTLINLNALKVVGGYDEANCIEDWYMWLKLADADHKIAVIPDILVKYRQHGQNMSSNSTKMFESRKRIIEAYQEHRLYPQAMAMTYASAAHGSLGGSKLVTLGYLAMGMKYSLRILPTPNFVESLLRISVPMAFLLAAKRIIN